MTKKRPIPQITANQLEFNRAVKENVEQLVTDIASVTTSVSNVTSSTTVNYNAAHNVISSGTTVAEDYSYVVGDYLDIEADFTISGNLVII